jgi:type I restriction-modification system DNA methylase subunit
VSPNLLTEGARHSTEMTWFTNTSSASSPFLAKDKRVGGRDRRGETLFIDARKLGQSETRVNRVFDDDDIAKIANAYHAWRQDGETSEDYGEASVTCLDLLAMKIPHLIGAMSQTSIPSSIRHRQVAES